MVSLRVARVSAAGVLRARLPPGGDQDLYFLNLNRVALELSRDRERFTRSLPDFLCRQAVNRYTLGWDYRWTLQDRSEPVPLHS
jgi:hypothetical protein